VAEDIHLEATSVKEDEASGRVYITFRKCLLVMTQTQFIHAMAWGKRVKRLEAMARRERQ